MRQVTIDNRYKILRKLGAGSMGDVYKVRDLKDKRIIALKMLSREKTSSEAVQRFKREFRLLAELHHPNLCSVYDFGMLRDGRSYFTMEYIDGKDIYRASKGLSYKEIYPWIVQLCRALEYIHSKGLLHYDIKPGNVLIAKGKEQGAESKKPYAQSLVSCVKLMDFGLAGEERIKGGTLIRGTFPYIAPEVIKGLAIDHRADLYSLGVLLYGIFTKRSLHVKGKKSFATLLEQQREMVFEPPSKIVKSMPERLEQLIVHLLSFEPAARFSRANEVIKEINKFTRLRFKLETKKTLEAYFLSSRFVGRDKEINTLKSFYKRAQQGEGKVILITGDAGIGKTRLLNEFRIFTQLRRSHCFTGYARKDKTEPLQPFHGIFSELINYMDRSKQSRFKELRLSLAVLFKIFPDLADGSLKRNLPKLVPLDPKQEKLRTFESLSELIRHTALELGKLVILLEDLHWADDLSIQFLEYLGRNIEGKNIFICGTSRKEELEENLALKKVITSLKGEGCLSKIELKPLKFRSLYSFLDSTITSGSNSSELVRYLMGKTDGNPFFVEEIMRTLLRKKGMSIGEKIGIEDLKRISIPETIEDIVLRRIEDLDSNSQNVVKFGVILLKDFGYNLMKKLTGLEDTELSKSLWELKSRQVLVEKDNRYRFYHATLREVVNKRLGYREKRELNYRVGKTLESISRGRIDNVVEDLAYYFINAKDHKKGIQYGLRAAKKSSERYALEQAISFYKSVLVLLGNKEPKLHFDILQKLSKIENLVGHYDNAIKHYKKALSLKTGSINKKIKVYLGIGNIYGRQGELNKELHIYQKASRFLKMIKRCKLKALMQADITVRKCILYIMMGDYKKANKFNFDALKFPKLDFKEKKAMILHAHINHTMGGIEFFKALYTKSNYDKAIFYYKEACKYYKKIRDEYQNAAVLNNLSVCYYYKFGIRKAFVHFHKAIQIFEKIGDQFGLAHSLCNFSNILRNRGYYLKALNYLQRALSISKKIGHPLITATSLWQIGDCFLLQCDFKSAKEHFEKALKVFHTIGVKEKETYPIESIGNVYKAKGDYTLALRCYRDALRISKDIGQQRRIASLFSNMDSIFIEIGDFLKAKRYIKDALKIASAIGEEKIEMECYIHLCRINILMEDYITAIGFYKKGIKSARKMGMKSEVLRFFLLVSEIYYHGKKYLKGIKIADKAIKIAKEMGTKDLYVKALLIKANNEVKQGALSKIEILGILNEVKRIAEGIGCPEILWKVYFEYGRFLQDDEQYLNALDYYEKCNDIFGDVSNKIKNESYRKSYLNRPDRQLVDAAINEIERLHD